MTGSAFLHTLSSESDSWYSLKHNGYPQPSICRLSPSVLQHAWPAVVSVLLAYLMWLMYDNVSYLETNDRLLTSGVFVFPQPNDQPLFNSQLLLFLCWNNVFDTAP